MQSFSIEPDIKRGRSSLTTVLKRFDFFPRLKEGHDDGVAFCGSSKRDSGIQTSDLNRPSKSSFYCVRTSPKALIMLLSQLAVLYLSLIEVRNYLEVRVKQEFTIDTQSPILNNINSQPETKTTSSSAILTPEIDAQILSSMMLPPDTVTTGKKSATTTLMRLRFNITIEDLPCYGLSLDYQNVMGVRAVDVKKNIWKRRMKRVFINNKVC